MQNCSPLDPGAEEKQHLSYKLPITHEVIMKDHLKTVSAIDIDFSGSRLISGSYDYSIKYWDFHGMDRHFKPFRTKEPCGDYSIRQVKFNPRGDRILIIPNSSQAKIYDRDGHELAEMSKGDQYLMDMKNTKGHIASMNAGDWSPFDKDIFLTAAADSTIRIWNVNETKKQKNVIMVKSKVPGGKSPVTAAKFSNDGKLIYCASEDGSLKLWSVESSLHRPISEIERAHASGIYVSSIAISENKSILVSRGGDHTLKIWDLRKLKTPLKIFEHMSNEYPETNCLFSPTEELILTCTSVKRGPSLPKAHSQIIFIDSTTHEAVYHTPIHEVSVVSIVWHAKLNQIAVGKNDGSISIFYHPDYSSKGAKLCLSKVASYEDDFSVVDASRTVYTPHALPMFRGTEQKSLKRIREKERLDPLKSKLPELPVTGPGKGGKIGSGLTQHIMKNIIVDTSRNEDPREALLKYAKLAEEQPLFVAPAYKKTQPKPVFSTETDENEK